MALADYLTSEVCADCTDGLISRREAMRRLGLLGLSAAAAGIMLAACGSDSDSAGATTSGASSANTGVTATTGAAVTPAPGTTAAGTTAAGTSAAGTSALGSTAAGSTAPGTTVPGLGVERVTFAGPEGEVIGSWSAADQPLGGVLIIHENAGLTPHFQALPGRFAASGYSALAVDLLSAVGGTSGFSGPAEAMAALGALPEDQLVAEMRAAVDELARRVPGKQLGAVGFCFGGGQVWSLLAAGEPRLAAAAPFYGPGPSGADFSGSKAAVLGIYAEKDSRVNGTKQAMDDALTAAGLVHELRVFPGVDHAFFNDTGQRYDATQAAAAYAAVLDWFGKYLEA
jgi:carboxymethylenebutenolidase